LSQKPTSKYHAVIKVLSNAGTSNVYKDQTFVTYSLIFEDVLVLPVCNPVAVDILDNILSNI